MATPFAVKLADFFGSISAFRNAVLLDAGSSGLVLHAAILVPERKQVREMETAVAPWASTT
ncbi:hypothetical protein [Streptomyces anulatus]|uniref:hypothetical protein n=1 Tax=Streptomyces anulatus TaxID=1892 RepID=UPI001C27E979|nr:hypothetical protein [Streptomyces anulatus]